RVGDRTVETVKDYLAGVRATHGRAEPLTLPSANVLAYVLEGGAQVTLRPSGTEPKIKYYFELPERLSPGESVPTARARREQRLAQLERDFLALATARGHATGGEDRLPPTRGKDTRGLRCGRQR